MASQTVAQIDTQNATREDLLARIAELERKNANQNSGQTSTKLSLKVSAKGGVSVYGLGRFPVTLYSSQMVRLLDSDKEIREFMEKNKTLLKTKEQE